MKSEENIAKVDGSNLPISTKHSIEICNFIRGKNFLKSKAFLSDVIAEKRAVPFKRYKGDIGHKPGKLGPGRYPKKACQVILKLLESLEINAQNKGLDTATLYIKEAIPNKASNVWRHGRQRRRRMKLTHIFMVVEEAVKEKKSAKKEEGKKATQELSKTEAPKENNEPKGEKQQDVKKEPKKKPEVKK